MNSHQYVHGILNRLLCHERTDSGSITFLNRQVGEFSSWAFSGTRGHLDHFSLPSTSSMPIDGTSIGSTMVKYIAYRRRESGGYAGRGTHHAPHSATNADSNGVGRFTPHMPVTIGSLPDNILLEIFGFYRSAVMSFRDCAWDWYTLTHVCSRWRQIILASSHFLDLRLICTDRTPVIEILDAFPTFPIIISYLHNASPPYDIPQDVGNIYIALGRHDQARWISLTHLTSLLLEIFVSVMQEPFPSLTFLELQSNDGNDEIVQALPNTFLGMSAPCLQYLILQGIPFPSLPELLFSTNHLVSLHLADIPITGYISPEALATGLSMLPRLTWLIVTFSSPTPPIDRTYQRSPPVTSAVLPSLTFLSFRGITEYLEDLVARISAPLLNLVRTSFFDQLTFDIPQLFRFIGRSKKLRSPKRATVSFYHSFANIVFGPREGIVRPRHFSLRILCGGSNRQVSSVTRICNQALPLLSKVERLDVKGGSCLQPAWQDDMHSTQWLELLHPFFAVERLHISERLGPLVIPAFQELTGERATAVLPELQSLFLEGLLPSVSVSVQEAIALFRTARHTLGRPIAILWGDSEWAGG
jgi:hypothetical protein